MAKRWLVARGANALGAETDSAITRRRKWFPVRFLSPADPGTELRRFQDAASG